MRRFLNWLWTKTKNHKWTSAIIGFFLVITAFSGFKLDMIFMTVFVLIVSITILSKLDRKQKILLVVVLFIALGALLSGIAKLERSKPEFIRKTVAIDITLERFCKGMEERVLRDMGRDFRFKYARDEDYKYFSIHVYVPDEMWQRTYYDEKKRFLLDTWYALKELLKDFPDSSLEVEIRSAYTQKGLGSILGNRPEIAEGSISIK